MYVGKELLWIEILLKYCRIVQARLSVLYIARWMHGLLLFLRVQLHVGHILAIQLLKICLCYLILNHGMNNQLASNIIFQENKVCEECNLRVKKQAKFFSSHFLQWEIEFSCQGLRIFSWKWGGEEGCSDWLSEFHYPIIHAQLYIYNSDYHINSTSPLWYGICHRIVDSLNGSKLRLRSSPVYN